jgi:hypothetical protein
MHNRVDTSPHEKDGPMSGLGDLLRTHVDAGAFRARWHWLRTASRGGRGGRVGRHRRWSARRRAPSTTSGPADRSITVLDLLTFRAGGTGTAAHIVPAIRSVAILLTQVGDTSPHRPPWQLGFWRYATAE